MNREIKFRAFSDRIGMFNVDVLAISECTWDCPDHGKRGVSIAYQPSIKLMQYTGLKDKNGKEIYEGDIVRATYDGAIGHSEIIWDSHKAMFMCVCNRIKERPVGGWYAYDWAHRSVIEVIGNIYENPELLSNQ
jgi:uncharacterized phage protein (TIGR01671 family)